MGWEVIALGSLDFIGSVKQEKIELISEGLKKIPFVVNVKTGNGFINLELSGNKGIDYTPFKEFIKQHKQYLDFPISFAEYCSTGEGLYIEDESELMEIEN